jgi:hypothetical protein
MLKGGRFVSKDHRFFLKGLPVTSKVQLPLSKKAPFQNRKRLQYN